MTPETRAFLLASDIVGGDPNIDYDALREEIAAAKPAIEALVGLPLEFDDSNENANFLVQLVLFEPFCRDEEDGWYAGFYRIAVGFSSYARMACVFTSRLDGGDLSEFPVAAIESALAARGFRVVAHEDLKERYDGPSRPHYPHCRTWFDRYFGFVSACDCALKHCGDEG